MVMLMMMTVNGYQVIKVSCKCGLNMHIQAITTLPINCKDTFDDMAMVNLEQFDK